MHGALDDWLCHLVSFVLFILALAYLTPLFLFLLTLSNLLASFLSLKDTKELQKDGVNEIKITFKF